MRLFGRAVPRVRYAALGPEQAEACAALHAGGFAHGWSALDFERLIAARSSWSDAARDARTGTLVGFILSRGASGEAEILTVAVAEEARRHGIGRGLLDRHIARLEAQAVGELFLEVAEDNAAARALYARAGFVEVGRRPAYYRGAGSGPAVAALILRRALR